MKVGPVIEVEWDAKDQRNSREIDWQLSFERSLKQRVPLRIVFRLKARNYVDFGYR
jgi:hypothetical protein